MLNLNKLKNLQNKRDQKIEKIFKIIFTLISAFICAQICLFLKTPLPWMVGPLLGTALLSVFSVPVESSVKLRNLAQWIMGTSLGLYFTPQIINWMSNFWWAILLNVIWTLLLGYIFGIIIFNINKNLINLDNKTLKSTSYFAYVLGSASEITLLAEREKARTDLVVASHTIRVLIVTLTIPFLIHYLGFDNDHSMSNKFNLINSKEIYYLGLFLLFLFTIPGILIILYAKKPNPYFLGALFISIILTSNNYFLSNIPKLWLNLSQLVLGVSLGVRFKPSFLKINPSWLICASLGSVFLMGFCILFALVLVYFTGIPFGTLWLATSPGGLAEMAITAQILELGVATVTAFHVCRLVGILIFARPLFCLLYK